MDFSIFLSNSQQPLIESIIGNTLLAALIAVLGLFDGVFGFIEFLDHGGSVKLLLKAAALTAVIIALCICVKPMLVLLLVGIAVFLMILRSVRKRERKKDQRIIDLIGAEGGDFPSTPELTASWEYKQAGKCIAEGRPRDAIAYLRQCRGKITGQPRFFISYADALMMLGNFSGALAKLNAIPSTRLKQKDVFTRVMVRKAYCYHDLHEYTKELECCDALLAKNIQPETFYFRRGQVKLRMLEVAPYLKPVEQAIADASSSQQSFIEGIFNDLDKALQYNKQGGEYHEGEILSCKGACHIHAKAYQESWTLLMEAKSKNEFYPNTYVYLGIYQYDKRNLTQAIGELRKAISYDQKFSESSDVACYYLAKIYYEMDKYDNAIRYAAQSLSIFAYRSECFNIQGSCYQKKLMYTEAIECYTKAIELEPKAQYYVSRARCYYCRNGASAKAYCDMREAIKLKDNNDYRLTALVYRADMDKEKDIQKDITELNELLAPFQDDPNNFIDLGIIYSKYQYFEESQRCYRKAIEQDPESNIAHYDLALLLRELELNSEAIEELNIAIELEPMDVKYYRVLANCYQDMNDPVNETLVLSRLSKVYQAHCRINKSNGDAVYQLGKYSAAAEYYRAALEYYSSPAVLNNLACAYYAQELYDDAVKSLEEAIRLDGQYFLAYFNLGNCRLRMGENRVEESLKKMAKKNFETAVSLNAELEQASLMLNSMDTENIEMLLDVPKHK